MRLRCLTVVFLALGIAACDDPVPLVDGEMPSSFFFLAEATGGDTLSCRLDYVFNVESEKRLQGRVEYRGRFGGDAYRAHLQEDGSGEAFWADVGGEFLITLLPGDSVEFRSIVPPSDEHYRFWDHQLFFAGRRGSATLGAGPWSCQPLDVRSDTTGIADGTWRFTAEHDGGCTTCIP